MKLNPSKTGLTLGFMISGVHLVWSVLIASGLAEGPLDFILGLHMLANPFAVSDFDLAKAGMLIAITFAVGYGVGYIFANIWNKVHK